MQTNEERERERKSTYNTVRRCVSCVFRFLCWSLLFVFSFPSHCFVGIRAVLATRRGRISNIVCWMVSLTGFFFTSINFTHTSACVFGFNTHIISIRIGTHAHTHSRTFHWYLFVHRCEGVLASAQCVCVYVNTFPHRRVALPQSMFVSNHLFQYVYDSIVIDAQFALCAVCLLTQKKNSKNYNFVVIVVAVLLGVSCVCFFYVCAKFNNAYTILSG